MTHYAVAYELRNERQAYRQFYEELEAFPAAREATGGCWTFETGATAAETYYRLRRHLEPTDSLVLFPIAGCCLMRSS